MWKNPKYTGTFKGGYERDIDGQRIFTLRSTTKTNIKKTFESWQMARKLNWYKI